MELKKKRLTRFRDNISPAKWKQKIKDQEDYEAMLKRIEELKHNQS